MQHNRFDNKTSRTPKRRRLNALKVTRQSLQFSPKLSPIAASTAFSRRISGVNSSSPEVFERLCDSPPLPCNQDEYLRASSSPQIPNSSILRDLNAENWHSPISSVKSSKINSNIEKEQVNIELEDINHDMFKSNLELLQENEKYIDDNLNHVNYKDTISEAFNQLEETISAIDDKDDVNILFATRDSFLLDLKETVEVSNNHEESSKKKNHEESSKKINNSISSNKTETLSDKIKDNFYGLPELARKLFKLYRNIDNFYEWQEECLNLKSIKNRTNLIYALPTSGGKTLVAEVLMLREVLNNHRNALFILPYVALVQEKIWALSPFAVQLEFLVEEYAAGKGHLPPIKRRKKNSIYIATIEKALALVRSLIELNRLNELGLIVVDELHLIGEAGRGGTLEMLLSTVLFANKSIQIVGMSATIGNLPELCRFLNAELYQRNFRPVELTEYVKLGSVLYRIDWTNGLDLVYERNLTYEYSSAGMARDPDQVGGIVSEVVPKHSCLVFCATKRSAENVAAMLAALQRRDMLEHRMLERKELCLALKTEGSSRNLICAVSAGVAYHHAGLASDERKLLEEAFRNGSISVLCATSTLAAGVNLPAFRVVLRSPKVAHMFMSLGSYRQMVGRAGRAGLTSAGESILICSNDDWPSVRDILSAGLAPALSNCASAVPALVLSAVSLKLATTRTGLQSLLSTTLLSVQAERLNVNVKELCDTTIRDLIKDGALESSQNYDTDRVLNTDSELCVSKLGNAAIKGCMDLNAARVLVSDMGVAARGLVLLGALHLLYLVAPQDVASLGIRPDYRNYYNLYVDLDEEGLQTARVIGLTENNAVRMITGKPITSIPESTLGRFYAALMLRDLWRHTSLPQVADKYLVPRGAVQTLMTSCSSFASCAHKLCEELPDLWGFRALFAELASRLQHCAAPHLQQLMELPAVKKARALQLYKAGYKSVQEVARASPPALCAAIQHLTRGAAVHLVSAAKMMLIEKVENLRAEAEEVMDELNS